MERYGEVRPADEWNRELVANVHPPGHVNPRSDDRYNLVVIGAGTAGLVTAAGAAGVGARVALVERHLLGGDCLNVGCVPSKAVIRSSRVMAELAAAGPLGIRVPKDPEVDFAAVMERMRRVRAKISHHDSVRRFAEEVGVDVYLGGARFAEDGVVSVGDRRLRYHTAVLCTGARAATPSVPGLAEAGYLTNETVFSLTERPRRLAVIGGGPIGCELAQAFRRLGSELTLIHDKGHILDREDPDAAEIVQQAFVREGITLLLDARITRVEARGEEKVLHVSSGQTTKEVVADAILVGAGRQPNVEDMDLEKVGVRYDPRRGVRVDDRLRTSNRRIYAAGDVCMDWKFTHAADFAARIVIQNALFFGRRKLSGLLMPWATYTDPEIAHVGQYEHEARAQGIEVDTFVRPMEEVDRALADAQTEGFVKVHVKRGSDRILGGTIVSAHAGELIGELGLAIQAKVGLGALANVIHPYPTQSEALRQVGDLYNRTRLTPGVKRLFQRFLAWRR